MVLSISPSPLALYEPLRLVRLGYRSNFSNICVNETLLRDIQLKRRHVRTLRDNTTMHTRTKHINDKTANGGK